MGLIEDALRLPLVALAEDHQGVVESALKRAGLLDG